MRASARGLLAIALGAALFGFAPTAAQAAASSALAAFEAICLAGHGDLARVRTLAAQDGWSPAPGSDPNPFRLSTSQALIKTIDGRNVILSLGEGAFMGDAAVGMKLCAVTVLGAVPSELRGALRADLGIAPTHSMDRFDFYAFTSHDGTRTPFTEAQSDAAEAAEKAGTLEVVNFGLTDRGVALIYALSTGPRKSER